MIYNIPITFTLICKAKPAKWQPLLLFYQTEAFEEEPIIAILSHLTAVANKEDLYIYKQRRLIACYNKIFQHEY